MPFSRGARFEAVFTMEAAEDRLGHNTIAIRKAMIGSFCDRVLCENPAEAKFQEGAIALRRRLGTLVPLEPPLTNDHTGRAWNRRTPASIFRQWIHCRLGSLFFSCSSQ